MAPPMHEILRSGPAILAADNAEERTGQIESIRDRAFIEPIWIDTDHDGFITDWHPAAPRLLGYSRPHLKGRDLALVFITARPQRNDLTRALQDTLPGFDAMIRPRDRRASLMRCHIKTAPTDTPLSPSLRWMFTAL